MEHATTSPFQCPDDRYKLLVCGLPHSLIGTVIEECRIAVARKYGSCDIINLNDLTPETRAHIAASCNPVIFWADCPDRQVVEAVREASFPVIILDINFANACKAFMHMHKTELMGTLRSMALAKMGIWQMADIPRAAFFPSADGTGIAILNEIGFTPREDLLEKIASAAGEIVKSHRIDHHSPNQVEREMGNDDDIIHQFHQLYGKQRMSETRIMPLPIPALFNGTPPYNPMQGAIDLCGQARIIAFGPYIYLPEGAWEASFTFDSSGNSSENSFLFDIVSDGKIIFEENLDLRKDGKFQYKFQFIIENAWSAFEFRTHLGKGSIQGRFSPIELILTRIADIHHRPALP